MRLVGNLVGVPNSTTVVELGEYCSLVHFETEVVWGVVKLLINSPKYRCFVDLVILLMCLDHVRSLLMVTPRYFTSEQGVRVWPFREIECVAGFLEREMISSCVFC